MRGPFFRITYSYRDLLFKHRNLGTLYVISSNFSDFLVSIDDTFGLSKVPIIYAINAGGDEHIDTHGKRFLSDPLGKTYIHEDEQLQETYDLRTQILIKNFDNLEAFVYLSGRVDTYKYTVELHNDSKWDYSKYLTNGKHWGTIFHL